MNGGTGDGSAPGNQNQLKLISFQVTVGHKRPVPASSEDAAAGVCLRRPDPRPLLLREEPLPIGGTLFLSLTPTSGIPAASHQNQKDSDHFLVLFSRTENNVDRWRMFPSCSVLELIKETTVSPLVSRITTSRPRCSRLSPLRGRPRVSVTLTGSAGSETTTYLEPRRERRR